MASIYKYRGRWRAQVRLKGQKPVSETFDTKAEAMAWSRKQEAAPAPQDTPLTYADLADRYASVTKAGYETQQVLKRLKSYWGHWRLGDITTEALCAYAINKQREGLQPSTIYGYLNMFGTAVRHGGVLLGVKDWQGPKQAHTAAIDTLRTLGVVSTSEERDRRPTEKELIRLEQEFAHQPTRKAVVPLMDLVLFAICSCMRLGEIVGPGGLLWEDFDEASRMILVRDRKDPRPGKKSDEWVPLLRGPVVYKGEVIDPVDIINRQPTANLRTGRIFPYRENTVSAGFARKAEKAGIEDLRFHDLRHDGISRLFEAKYSIPEVQKVSGHKSWKHLERYVQLDPKSLHR